MDEIFLHDLTFDTLIGVYEWERRLPRPVRFDVELATDTRAAAETDEIDRTIDYEQVANRIQDIAQREPHRLLETLGEEIVRTLFEAFPCDRVRLTIGKPGAVAGAREVGIRIERHRSSG